MKTQKLLVIVALVCLMAFLNVLTFAQPAQAQPKPGLKKIQYLRAALKDAGFKAKRVGNDLVIEEQVVLKEAFTVQDFKDLVDKIEVSLVEPEGEDPPDPRAEELSAEELLELQQLRQCWSSSEFIYNYKLTTCEFNLTDVGDLTCKIGATAELVLNWLNCIFAYLD